MINGLKNLNKVRSINYCMNSGLRAEGEDLNVNK